MTRRSRYHGLHFDWMANLGLLVALAAVALMAAAVCCIVPWS